MYIVLLQYQYPHFINISGIYQHHIYHSEPYFSTYLAITNPPKSLHHLTYLRHAHTPLTYVRYVTKAVIEYIEYNKRIMLTRYGLIPYAVFIPTWFSDQVRCTIHTRLSH